jgi:hypothetical protein
MRQPVRVLLSTELILRLQTTAGNRAVQRLIERNRPKKEEPAPVPAMPEPEQQLAPSWGQWFGRLASVLRTRRSRSKPTLIEPSKESR